MQIFICDDEKQHIDMFQETLNRICAEQMWNIELYSFAGAKQLWKELGRRRKEEESLPQIVFSDIEMPGMDGIALGKALNESYPEICLVLLTAYSEFAIAGYETGAYRYLLKPVQQSDISKIIAEIYAKEGREEILLVKDGPEDISLNLKQILYISAEDKYLVVHTADHKYLDRNSLQYYEERFKELGFYRVHRKYLVNQRHHKGMYGCKIVLSNGETIPVSRSKKTDYYNTFLKRLEEGCLK